MRSLRLAALLLLVGTSACYEAAPQQSTLPEPGAWSGPPGGTGELGQSTMPEPGQPADPSGYPPGYPAGYPQGYPSGDQAGFPDGSYAPDTTAMPEPSSDPQDPGYVMGDVTDPEINATLDPYGSWVDVDGYGRVWRPDPTIVGGDFTPYDSGGTWVDTDYGWSFAADYAWGWLPFHYGRWDYFDEGGYWGWVPDHTWGPAWVEWRSGGDYVGCRPLRPTGPQIRDHRHRDDNAHWSFTTTAGFRQPHRRDHLAVNDGLRLTATVARPPLHGEVAGRAATLMTGRLQARFATGGGRTQPNFRAPPTRTWNGGRDPRAWNGTPPRTFNGSTRGVQQPTRTWDGSTRGYQQPVRTYQQPTYAPPTRSWSGPTRTYQQPTYAPPTRSWSGPSPSPSRSYTPTYSAPSRSYTPTYSAPSRSYTPTYSAPSHSSYSAPSHSSYSAPSHSSYSAPSHSSSGGGGGSSSHSSGGGHHR